VARLNKELGLSDPKYDDWVSDELIAVAIELSTSQMNGPSEPVKFLARRLAFFPKNTHEAPNTDMNILLGTPLYVCSDWP
jgi:hypothetical protein